MNHNPELFCWSYLNKRCVKNVQIKQKKKNNKKLVDLSVFEKGLQDDASNIV